MHLRTSVLVKSYRFLDSNPKESLENCTYDIRRIDEPLGQSQDQSISMNNSFSFSRPVQAAASTAKQLPDVLSNVEDLIYASKLQSPLTKAYRVTKEVADFNYEQTMRERDDLVEMTEEDMQEIRDLLDIPSYKLHKPLVTKNSCPSCGRHMHFADLINGALAINRHSKEFMGDVLMGKYGYFVIVPGVGDDSHKSKCLKCGDMSMSWNHNTYTVCSGNSYAHCAW
jgi:hypothetical protein